MIDSISGKIFKKEPTSVYVQNGGIVFNLSICLRDYEKLPSVGDNVFIYTYLNVKENLMELYGFMDLERRSLFSNLLDVSGIGPRTAINLLSNASVSSFKDNIISEDVKSLSLIPGIGPKTAKRIILDIKEKHLLGLSWKSFSFLMTPHFQNTNILLHKDLLLMILATYMTIQKKVSW